MKFLNKIFFAVIGLAIFTACEEGTPETESLNYVGFDTATPTVYLDPAESVDLTVDLYSTQSSFDVSVAVDAETSTLSPDIYSLGDVAYEGNKASVNLTLSGFAPEDIVNKTVTFVASSETGYTSEPFTVTTLPNCPTMFLSLDAYPEETYWFIFDATGTPVAWGGINDAFNALNNEYVGMSSAIIPLCDLSAGDYTLGIRDAYGDGGASYELKVNKGVTTLVSVAGDQYTTGVNVPFTIE